MKRDWLLVLLMAAFVINVAVSVDTQITTRRLSQRISELDFQVKQLEGQTFGLFHMYRMLNQAMGGNDGFDNTISEEEHSKQLRKGR